MRSVRSRTFLSFVVATWFVVAPTIVYAQDPHEPSRKAEIHYQSAVRLFGEGRYRESLDEFNLAIDVKPEPVFFCNRALVEIKLQETAAAVESLRACRDGFEGDEAELAAIDAQLQGVSAFQFVIRPQAMTVAQDIASGPVEDVAQPRPAPGWDLADFGYLSMGLGVALLASAATLDLVSADLKDDFITESQGGPGTSRTRYDELKDELDVRKNIFYGLAVSGAVVTAVGAGLVVTHFIQADTGEVTFFPVVSDRGEAGVGLRVDW